MTSQPSIGEVGYRAYAASTGGKTYDDRQMPAWNDLPEHVKRAWEHAAMAIAHSLQLSNDQ